MKTEPQRTCPSCGNEFSGAMQFCPVCMLRKGLAGGVESGGSSASEDTFEPATLNEPAPRFEHYELVTGEDGKPVELGRGAMGVTYKAFDVDLRCPVTLKVISEKYLGDESARLRFLREARSAARLRHSNVASVLHLGRTGNSYFYAMEFVEGETLENLIKRSGRLEVKLALEIATQVAAGLAAVHEQKLVHRDIKPTNIMVRLKEEGSVTAKIIDLGLAKTLDESGSEAGISSPGAFVGTPEFASPEQFAGLALDTRSDLYSLGVTLWEMLTGTTPFRGTPGEVMYQHQHVALPLEELEGVPEPVVVLLEALLEKDPGRRFQNPGELSRAMPTIVAAIDAGRSITRQSLQKAPSAALPVGTRKPPARHAPEKISVARLPVTGSNVFGREEDIAFLDDVWANHCVNVVTIVAWAGVGKSTLVNHWLGRMAAEQYRSAELVFGWSFYRQGTRGDTSSADEFLDAALTWFGDPDPRIGTAWEKGERLAKLVAHRRTLLVLDGLEPLQKPPGSQEGRLRERSLQALLRELAAFNTGLCVITTRMPVADLADHEQTSALRRELDQLSSDAGARLLRALGVTGHETELRTASEEFAGHCLALTLLGSYLTDAYNGDIRRRKEVSEHLAHDVREYFGDQLRCQQTEAWKECNRRLYNHYRALVPQLPDSFRDMEPLFLAVICGCRAGLFREALHEIYISRIQRGNASFAANVLGARGAVLSVLAHFFEPGRWGSPAEMGVEGQSLTAEDHLYILMQTALYLTVTRGFAAPEARTCYERVESLAHSLNRPLLLYSALISQWRYSLWTDKLTATMQIAERVYSLAQEQDDARLMMGAYRILASTLYFLGDFEASRQYAIRGLEIWRSGGVQRQVEEVSAPAVNCLNFKALTEWHLGEIASSRTTMAEAIPLAKELNDMPALAVALFFAAYLAHFEGDRAEVELFASDLIELSTRQNFAIWLPIGAVLRGWARSASSDTESISWIEDGIGDYKATGSIIHMPYFLALKAEALHLADRTSQALEAIADAEAWVERSEERWWCAELRRLRGVFLTTLGAEETQIEASFCAAIRIAREQKSVSLVKRAEATYAEYRRQKDSGSGRRGFRLPLW
jgi:serine/threonine protein kinase